MVIIKGKIIIILHPITKDLVRVMVRKYDGNGKWWVQLKEKSNSIVWGDRFNNGELMLVGATELFWPQWMFPKSKRTHNL